MKDAKLDSRLKKIRKELSLIDKDLKALAATTTRPASASSKPRVRSRELSVKDQRQWGAPEPKNDKPAPKVQQPVKSKPASVLKPQGTDQAENDKDGRFLEYLSSSFNSGRPLGQERRIQRNKAILMLVIVLFILFLVLYRMMT